jgi:cyclopropane-fatty-acyl-phospholipid synthase
VTGRAGVAPLLAGFAGRLTGAGLPVRLRAFDGSESGPAGAPAIELRSPMALRRLLWSPNELGLADAFVTGAIEIEGDLIEVMRLMRELTRQRMAHQGGTRAWLSPADLLRAAALAVRTGVAGPRPPVPAGRARLTGRLHSRHRDRAAIAHHYDVSNEFYRLLLDPAMTYSCAYWTGDSSLEQAQRDKLDLVCAKLAMEPGTRLLDVGCGWGSLVEHAARHYGAQVTGVTLSDQQAAFARGRLADAGLSAATEIRLADYRDVDDGPYEAIAVIEMGEHVGRAGYPAFAARLRELLAPGGRLLIQQMSRGGSAPGGGAFISSYIAPDMYMRPLPATLALLEQAGLEIRGVQALREHYVTTFRTWLATLDERLAEAADLIGDEATRVWRLFLAGGALAFEDGTTGVDQILAVPAVPLSQPGPISQPGAWPAGARLASGHPTPSPPPPAPG